MWGFWMLVLLLILVFATLPMHQHSRHWGYYPSGIIALVLLVMLALMWFGAIAVAWPWHAPPPP